MSVCARAGVLGSAFYFMHKSRAVFAEAKQDVGSKQGEYDLKLVQVIFRHGARTPLKPIPHKEQVEWSPALLETPVHTQFDYTVTDLAGGPRPHSPFEERYRSHKLKGGTFPGQLTAVGMQQMFDLGARLRKTYVEEKSFLSPGFKSSEVFVRSTNIVRNLESTRCLLAGLFQQQQEGPVTVVTSESSTEILYPNYQGCQELKHLTSNKMSLASSQPGMSDDLKKIQEGMNIDDEKDAGFFLLLDNLLAQEVHGFPCSLEDKPHLQRAESRVIDIVSYVMGPQNLEVLRLSVGPFLHALQSNILDVVNSGAEDAQRRKLYLYAAHDVTLIPLLMALGIFDQRWPPYAADLTLELYQHQASKEWFARLNYNGEEQVVRGCEAGLCPLEDFLSAISEFVVSPEEYLKECSRTQSGNDRQ
ncbi:lysophosphatidic acid phosphatase type 6 [Spea bombifrons]|uniref:lysophosphatidic acid phosphatase type 6 n=1 Tax=Spea bombifrons TaxID=233779 RepID=UPI0023496E49|nr:lysophosphatidic acid phosphatase type 6 [Spea bombifrons]